jgi:hypothetical protein
MWVLQINLLCVLGEVISEREATWYTVSARFCRVDRSGCRAGLNTPPNGLQTFSRPTGSCSRYATSGRLAAIATVIGSVFLIPTWSR